MTGYEFEQFVSDLFKKMGYTTQLTKASGDQGIDVIAARQGRKIGIQAKCYSNLVTNKAIQEVSAGIVHYKLDKGIVVTNSHFTNSARELALSNRIILWDRNMLKEKIKEFY
ncbi:restriction endonuclease [Paenibacillus sp. Sa2BVA9]|uniref:Restriction endonuclease n=2 Tax=Paenibacillus gallinarum TaxID=2762232 RepID=A0ABR8SYM9_9BACL|nr:restriction endonuclease [Paenibacillus gallinarum]